MSEWTIEDVPASLKCAPQRRRVFEFIVAEHRAGRGFPSMSAIQQHMGWVNTSGVYDCLRFLSAYDKLLGMEYQAHVPALHPRDPGRRRRKYRFWLKEGGFV